MRYWLFFSLMLAFLWFIPVQAQSAEPAAANVDTVAGLEVSAEPPAADEATAEVQPEVSEEPELEGVEIEEPKEVPSGVGLWWRGVKEKVKLATTVNSVKKAELQLKYAEERMRLAKLMAQKADDQKTQVRIHRMIGQAQEMMEKVEARRDRLMQENNERGRRLLRNIATHQIRREAAMDKIEEKLPEAAMEKFDQLREKAINQERRLLNAINNGNVPQEVREHLQDVKDRIEAHAEEVKQYREDRKELMEKFKAGDAEIKEQVKEELKELRQDRVEALKERREERIEDKKEFRQELKQEIKSEKLDNIKDGGEMMPKPVLMQKPGAVIKMKELKQGLKENFKKEKAEVKNEIKAEVKNKATTQPPSGAVDESVNSQL